MDEMETPSCRAASGTNASERARRETSTHVLFMTEAQLKKLDDAVLHRDIGIYNERLKTLKADLIREAHRHEEDFTIIEGDRSPALEFGIFVAFAMIYPRVELFLRIIAEWIALILTGAFIPFNCSPTTRGSDLAVVWTSIGAAFLFIELRGAGAGAGLVEQLESAPSTRFGVR